MRKMFIYLVFISLAAAIIIGCEKGKADRAKEEAIPVKVMKVKLEDLNRSLEYVGNVKGKDEALVYPKVSGKVIEKVKEDSSPINKGEAIVYIDRDEVGLKFERAPVESPLTGIVGRVYVDIGTSVTSQTPIALVANMSAVKIDLNIPERYLPQISSGAIAIIAVDAYPDRRFDGRVTKISPIVDLETRAAPIEITIDDKEHLLQSGMFAKVKLVIEERKGVPSILKEAIIGKEPNTYVYVIEDKKALLRKINVGIREAALVEVREGLREGERVVIMGQQKLRDGSLVEPEE